MRLGSFNQAALSSNPTLREAKYISWTQAELSYAIISATIPTARKLVLNFITYYNGGTFGSTLSQSGSQGNTIQMSTLKASGQRKSKAANSGSAQESQQRPVNDSQEMIIRKDVTVEVTREA